MPLYIERMPGIGPGPVFLCTNVGNFADEILGKEPGAEPDPPHCTYCQAMGIYLCDFKVGEGKTCDRPMCAWDRVVKSPKRDLCLEHAVAAGLLESIPWTSGRWRYPSLAEQLRIVGA